MGRPEKTERNLELVQMYRDGATYKEIGAHFNLSKRVIGDILIRYRDHVELRNQHRFPPSRVAVAKLALEGLNAREISERLKLPIKSTQTILTTLRREGRIGMSDGRQTFYSPPNPDGPHTMSALRLPVDYGTRTLLDGEAADLGLAPADLATKILRRVLNDQELLDLVMEE